MNSIDEAKVRKYLQYDMKYGPYDVGAILGNMTSLARTAGHEIDERYGNAGLGAGPENRVSSGIVNLALGGGGCETSEYAIRTQIQRWLLTTSKKGLLG